MAREDLETLLWADERPDGDALRSHMYKLRQAIDRPFDSPLIHTVHRIGYRIAEATLVETDVAETNVAEDSQ